MSGYMCSTLAVSSNVGVVGNCWSISLFLPEVVFVVFPVLNTCNLTIGTVYCIKYNVCIYQTYVRVEYCIYAHFRVSPFLNPLPYHPIILPCIDEFPCNTATYKYSIE